MIDSMVGSGQFTSGTPQVSAEVVKGELLLSSAEVVAC
jgi:hypothetical protein